MAADIRVGWIFEHQNATRHMAAMLTIEDERTTLEVPLAAGATDETIAWFKDEKLPEHLVFANTQGFVSLSGLHIRRFTEAGGTILRHGVLDIAQLVHCGVRAPDFSTVNGVRSEIAGLPRWMEPGVFTEDPRFSERKLAGVVFDVTAVPPTVIPSVPGLSLAPHFRIDHDWADGVHSMHETTQVETLFDDPHLWLEHLRLHRTLQDLVCLALWQPCDLVIRQAKRDDDPVVTLDDKDHESPWREAVVPSAGRGPRSSTLRALRTGCWPLFTFTDIGVDGVERWFAEYDQLGQAMWVLAASLFRSGGTIEVQLLQVGTALEALGYEIAARTGRLTRGKKDSSFTLVESLTLICSETDCVLDRVLAGATPEDWAVAFNSAYKGVKHADNSLPDPADAYNRAKQGALLARLWLARNLGAARDTLEKRLPGHDH